MNKRFSTIGRTLALVSLMSSCAESSGKGEFSGKTGKKGAAAATPEAAGDVETKTRKLTVLPAEVVLFKGESVDLKAQLSAPDQAVSDVTAKSTWSSLDKNIFSLTASKGKAVAAGATKVTATFEDLSATVPVSIVACQSSSPGSPAAKMRIDGENWPGNTIDKDGADFNDYSVTIAGKLLVDGFQLFSTDDQTLTIAYSLGSPGSTTQVVKLDVVDCNGVSKGSKEVSSGSGSVTLDSKKGDRFTLITTATTGTVVRVFDLNKEKGTAYRLTKVE